MGPARDTDQFIATRQHNHKKRLNGQHDTTAACERQGHTSERQVCQYVCGGGGGNTELQKLHSSERHKHPAHAALTLTASNTRCVDRCCCTSAAAHNPAPLDARVSTAHTATAPDADTTTHLLACTAQSCPPPPPPPPPSLTGAVTIAGGRVTPASAPAPSTDGVGTTAGAADGCRYSGCASRAGSQAPNRDGDRAIRSRSAALVAGQNTALLCGSFDRCDAALRQCDRYVQWTSGDVDDDAVGGGNTNAWDDDGNDVFIGDDEPCRGGAWVLDDDDDDSVGLVTAGSDAPDTATGASKGTRGSHVDNAAAARWRLSGGPTVAVVVLLTTGSMARARSTTTMRDADSTTVAADPQLFHTQDHTSGLASSRLLLAAPVPPLRDGWLQPGMHWLHHRSSAASNTDSRPPRQPTCHRRGPQNAMVTAKGAAKTKAAVRMGTNYRNWRMRRQSPVRGRYGHACAPHKITLNIVSLRIESGALEE